VRKRESDERERVNVGKKYKPVNLNPLRTTSTREELAQCGRLLFEISLRVKVLIAIEDQDMVIGIGALTEDMKDAIEAEGADHQIAAVNVVMTEDLTEGGIVADTVEETVEGTVEETEAEEFVTILKTKAAAVAEMIATSHMI